MLRSSLFCALVVLPSLASAEAPSAPVVVQAGDTTITFDVTETPELREWAQRAAQDCEKWYPLISDYLQTEGYQPPTQVRVHFKKTMRGIAYTLGADIYISAQWVNAHPDDFGMVIHELTHVVQGYPRNQPSWLVESIADYVRYWQFEPEAPRPGISQRKTGYRSGYGTGAAFLNWLVKTHDDQIVKKLNMALRRGACEESTLGELLGENINGLYSEFLLAEAANS